MTHPTITKELADHDFLKMAVDSMQDDEVEGPRVILGPVALERFAKSIYKLGRNAGLEEIVKWIAPQRNDVSATGEEFAEAIRYSFLKDNTPATLPDWMRDDAEDEQALMDRDMGDN